MSRKTWVSLALAFLLLPLPGQERARHLNPLFEVRDGDGEVFLQRPSQPVLLKDTVVVKDGEALLVLDGSGHLVQRVVRKGQGPGEWDELVHITRSGSGLALLTQNPSKVIVLDKGLRLLGEYRADDLVGAVNLLGADLKGGVCLQYDWEKASVRGDLRMNVVRLTHFAEDGVLHARSEEIHQRSVVLRQRAENGSIRIHVRRLDPLLSALDPQAHVVALACHEAWQVDLIDQENGKILRSVKRQVPRRPWTPGSEEDAHEGLPRPAYHHDILQVLQDGRSFWIVRSDIDPQAGVLVERMDAQGNLQDSFRLKLLGLAHPLQLEGRPLVVHGDRLVWIWKDGEDAPVVSACALVAGRS